MWGKPKDYVLSTMRANLFPVSVAMAMLSSVGLASAGAQARGAAAELPAGGMVFHERMMAWTAPAAAPTVPRMPVSQPLPRSRGATAEALPRLSSRFGYRGDPLLGTPRMHSGIDIPGPLGTPVRASANGTVRFAGTAGGYGRMVEIAHGGGLSTRYAHLSQIFVLPGTPVARGETIALMGSTGRSTGSHLHFEVRQNGRAANPLGYFGADGALGLENAPMPYFVWRAGSDPHISRFARDRSQAGKTATAALPEKEPF